MKQKTGIKRYIEETIDVCDVCKTLLSESNWITYDYTWSDGYDSFGNEINVCSLRCLNKELDTYKNEYPNFCFPGEQSVKLYAPSDVMKKLLGY